VIATIFNVVMILLGGILGLLLKNKISPRFSSAIVSALGLCVIGMGITGLTGTNNTLCVIICMVAGTLIGEWVKIEGRMERAGERLRAALTRGEEGSRFAEGFVSTTILYCVGAMSVNGALEAGLNQNYSILLSKGVIDGLTAITFTAAFGVGAICAAVPVLVYQGAITLLAQRLGPHLSDAVILEMSAVGGAIVMGIGFNMLGLRKEKLRVGNMIPAIFLPIVYLPLAGWITSHILNRL